MNFKVRVNACDLEFIAISSMKSFVWLLHHISLQLAIIKGKFIEKKFQCVFFRKEIDKFSHLFVCHTPKTHWKQKNQRRERKMKLGKMLLSGMVKFFFCGGRKKIFTRSLSLARTHIHSEATFYEKNGWRKLGNFRSEFFLALCSWKGWMIWIKCGLKLQKTHGLANDFAIW